MTQYTSGGGGGSLTVSAITVPDPEDVVIDPLAGSGLFCDNVEICEIH